MRPRIVLAAAANPAWTTVAIYAERGLRLERLASERFRSREHGSLAEILACAASRHSLPIDAAGVAVASAPWSIDARLLEAAIEAPVELLDPMHAQAWGLERLQPHQLAEVNPGVAARSGNAVVLWSGQGIRAAGLLRAADGPTVVEVKAAVEPRSELQAEAIPHFRRGLRQLHGFLRERGYGDDPPSFEPSPRRIVDAAVSGRSTRSQLAVDLFAGLLGAAAARIAVSTLATGGIYLTGPIAPLVLLDPLAVRARSLFRAAFVDHAGLGDLLRSTPVYVVLEEPVLLGAVHVALGSSRPIEPRHLYRFATL